MSNSKKTHRPSEVIKTEIRKLSPDLMLAHSRHMAAEKRHAILSEICIGELTSPKGGEDLTNPANLAGPATAWVHSDHGREMAAAAELVAILETSEPYFEAQKSLVPLLKELEAAEAAEADRSHQVALAKDAVRVAEETAKQKAVEASTADPSVIAARKQLESTLGMVS